MIKRLRLDDRTEVQVQVIGDETSVIWLIIDGQIMDDDVKKEWESKNDINQGSLF